jgi:serine/threonine protein kinase
VIGQNTPIRSNLADIKPRNLTKMILEISDEGVNLLENMLKFDPQKRISAQDALFHPYFM